jgi:TolB protein
MPMDKRPRPSPLSLRSTPTVRTRSRDRCFSVWRALCATVAASIAAAGCVQYTAAPAITPPRPTAPPVVLPTSNPPAFDAGLANAWVLLSIEENGYAHLFSLRLATSALTRISWGEWNDITPSISPDGKSIAFSSNRSGYWDLYVMDLRTAVVSQVTNTPGYEGSPVWSPDMAWMAYETFNDGQLDVAIRSMTDKSAAPVLLTDDPDTDHSPVWSPDGRKIAFVSNRTGDSDIWLADLDKAADRFINVTHTPGSAEAHPAWSSDGARLVWASTAQASGNPGIYVWDISKPGLSAVWTGSGTWPAWNVDGSRIVTTLDEPTQQLLGGYTLDGIPLMLPLRLPGRVRGLAWPAITLPDPLPAEILAAAQRTAPAPSAAPVATLPDIPSQRWFVVPLNDVQAPSAGLHALVEPWFRELRARLITDAGWDPLASLENSFVPITGTLDPGLEQDWLYTGRAFAINTLMLNAGWLSVHREDIGDQTYWRVYVRVQKQDGSQGAPIKDPPWDLNSRYQLDPQAYEAGGSFAPVPPGYWLDLTSLAELYGWHRLASLRNWRTYYAGARFSEFAHTDGLDWFSAMLELYPAEALITATPVLPPTITPSRTPWPTDTPYPTWTPRPTRTPSRTPTPAPPTTTRTPIPPSSTPLPTSTPLTVIPTFPSPTP